MGRSLFCIGWVLYTQGEGLIANIQPLDSVEFRKHMGEKIQEIEVRYFIPSFAVTITA